MERTIDFIERLRSRENGCSDYKISKLLNTQQSRIIKWKNYGGTMDDKYAIKIAELLELDPAYVVACMNAERADDEESYKVWARIAAKFNNEPRAH